MTLQSIISQTFPTASGKKVAVATLNVEKALNALNLEMVRSLTEQLLAWQSDDSIACVVLDGSGDKAFCAGGDVRAIYQASIAQPNVIPEQAKTFFSEEYQLDFLIHKFGKPIVVWGSGIVMGGGVGLMAGASHRIVTETSRIAMPEVTIGLFPDVGGSYFLNRAPGKTGLFLGLTAYQMNAADACYVGMANHYLNKDDKGRMFDAMSSLDWSDDVAINHQRLDEALNELSHQAGIPRGESVLSENQDIIDSLMAGSIEEIYSRVKNIDADVNWLVKARSAMLAGSPISCHLIYQQAQLGSDMTLADVFRWELGVSAQCCSIGDFAEGVRALLIDKDRNPQWKYDNIADVPNALISALTNSPWEQHPLSELGKA
ncbi:MAG: enoyl-CoA hydratase/isomerase family protein [Parashewanella sp.]